jgi:DNA-binding GntR family transcriptional regulator
MGQGLIQVQATVTRIACLRMTAQHLKALRDRVDHASCIPARSQWDRKAAAHAEIFSLLAGAADDPVASGALGVGAEFAHDLMLVVGPAADGMIANSRRRLLVHMAAGRADDAGVEMESHLRLPGIP